MEILVSEIERLREHFDEIDNCREKAYPLARELRRLSVQAVRDIQRGKFDAARELIDTSREIARELNNSAHQFGFSLEAHQEYTEAAFTLALITRAPLPTQEELCTNERGYLMGLADTIGELRRHVLNLLREDRVDEAVEYMDLMDDLHSMMMKFDYTDAVLPLRRKQDQFRGIIERTRADLTTIICQKRLEKKLDLYSAENS